jgi:hypothetical protein
VSSIQINLQKDFSAISRTIHEQLIVMQGTEAMQPQTVTEYSYLDYEMEATHPDNATPTTEFPATH